ncbi:MAG TPA: PQQ-like beta-propeller repeat protein, partial [Bacteroidia bacterium]|nr:PQQ-like beta-propeller repeat protein [Bacteroidia bacterium]
EKTGEPIWKHSYPQPLGDLYFQGGTTGTATVDGNRVYHLAREGELFCLEASSGKVLWQKHLHKDFGYTKPTWGFSGAPLVWDDWLFVNAGESGINLKKQDGSVIWKSGNEEAGYSTPYPLSRNGWHLVVFSNKRSYVCVDASNGTEVWSHKWMTRYGVNAADPIVSGDLILISSGYGKGATVLKWVDKGDPAKVWQSRDLQTQMNAPVLINGYLYGVSGNEGQDGTGLRCVELATGTVKWTDTGVGHGAVSAVKGHLLVLTEAGELQVAPVSTEGYSPTFKQSAVPPKVWTVPVFANGRVYCRNASGKLVVLDMKGE